MRILTRGYFQEKEYELSEVFHIHHDSSGNDVLTMTEVNKYSYNTADNNSLDNSIVAFEPLTESEEKLMEDIGSSDYDDEEEEETVESASEETRGRAWSTPLP